MPDTLGGGQAQEEREEGGAEQGPGRQPEDDRSRDGSGGRTVQKWRVCPTKQTERETNRLRLRLLRTEIPYVFLAKIEMTAHFGRMSENAKAMKHIIYSQRLKYSLTCECDSEELCIRFFY